MRLVKFLIRYSPGVLAAAVGIGVISGVASAGLMAIINRSLENVNHPATTIAVAFLGVTLTVLVANFVSRLILIRLSTRAVLEMRMNLSEQILVAPLREIERHGQSRLLAVLTEDILAVSDTLAEFPPLAISIAIIVACFSYLMWLSWPLALAFLGMFSLGVLVHESIARRTRGYLSQGREKWDELITYYHALVLGNKELKLHSRRREAFMRDGFEPTATAMQTLSYSWHKIFAIAASFGQTFYFMVVGAILFAAPLLGNFEATVLTGFVLLTIYMNGPISAIVGFLPTFERAGVAMDKIESLGLDLGRGRTSDIRGNDSRPLPDFHSLEIRDLSYLYKEHDEDRGFRLGPVNLDIQAGELVFIVGGNGSGKSSFARVLTGLYTPSEGDIRINEVSVDDSNRDDYRQNFSTVFADYFLFTALYGLLSDDLAAKVDRYLAELQLTGKVSLVDGRFSTVNLSQGQRKRLALLTAFVEDRNIYLFDEWAADQDPAFKDVFYYRILPDLKARGKTVIVISHDRQYYEVADRLVRFEEGQIVEDRRLERPTLPLREEEAPVGLAVN